MIVLASRIKITSHLPPRPVISSPLCSAAHARRIEDDETEREQIALHNARIRQICRHPTI